MPGRADVAVVIPAFEAAATIADVVSRTRRAAPDAVVYVVDDGSSDATVEQGRGAGATVLVHPRNRGKGAALATGIAAALEREGGGRAPTRVIVTLDADGQHRPEDLPRLAAPVLEGTADLVLGARAREGGMPWGRRCTNWLSAALASRIGGVPVPDAQSGFRALSRRVAEAIRPAERSYDFETAFLLAALAGGMIVRFVPVPTVYDGRPSHFRHWTDTWRLARVFTRYRRQIAFGAGAGGAGAR
jgi:glycosyltransferase involved in cell wall biosynthesis